MSDQHLGIDHAGPIRVGIAGLGRSGWNIHAKTIAEMPEAFQVVAVSDPSEDRRQEAVDQTGAKAFAHFEPFAAQSDLDVIVVASPNRLHAQQACDAMLSGKHVVCEKPMALTIEDADRMIEVATDTGHLLAPFQNRRYEPHFTKVQDILASGVLGDIVQIRMEWNFFTRRWDWQTMKDQGGGALNNHCAHLVDHAVQLFGEHEPVVFADVKRTLSVGDAEDHVKIVLYGEGSPTIDIETSSACAFPEKRWRIFGTSGGLRGDTEHLEWKWVDWDQMPERRLDPGAADARKYQREDYPWQFESWDAPANPPSTASCFYRDLARCLRRGEQMPITPESVRRQIAVVEVCRELCQV
ncbi:MAG: Gfo/Idh/MocA family oxidoreductase [Planctomycetota bacterium]